MFKIWPEKIGQPMHHTIALQLDNPAMHPSRDYEARGGDY